jgi:hypothetical protein
MRVIFAVTGGQCLDARPNRRRRTIDSPLCAGAHRHGEQLLLLTAHLRNDGERTMVRFDRKRLITSDSSVSLRAREGVRRRPDRRFSRIR